MVKSLIPINPTNNNAVVANARDWYGYFADILNNYVVNGLELTSISNVDIQIGLGRARIKGLIFSVTTAESITVTGNGDRYLHVRIIETNEDPTGVEFVFLDAISILDTDLFLGKVTLNGANTGFDIDSKLVFRESGVRNNDILGFPTEEDQIITQDTTIDSITYCRDLTVNEGVTLTISNNAIIIVQRKATIDGIISASGSGGGRGGLEIAGVYDEDGSNGEDGIGGLDGVGYVRDGSVNNVAGNGGTSCRTGIDQDKVGGVGGRSGDSGSAVMGRKIPSIFDLINNGYDYYGAGGGGGGSGGSGGGGTASNLYSGYGGEGGKGGNGSGSIVLIFHEIQIGDNGKIMANGGNGGDGENGENGQTDTSGAVVNSGAGGGGCGGSGGDGGFNLLYVGKYY